MSSQGTPRKFSEKIAIMERKQNEDQEAFTSIMRDVRSITSNSHRAQPVSTASLAPPMFYNRNSTSLPNVSDTTYYWSFSQQQQLLQQQQLQQQPQPQSAASPPHPCRSRSPGAAHYHPYKHAVISERSPPVDYNRMDCSNNHLQPPELVWQKARSDPAIHTYDELSASQSVNELMLNQVALQPQAQQMQQIQSLQHAQTQQHLQSQIRGQPQMQTASPIYIQPPQRRPEEVLAGSLPNMMPGPPLQPYNCHQPISQRHSMGICQTLAAPPVMNESMSAPTSPQQSYEAQAPPTYSIRNYSTSPEPMAPIPNIILTGIDGSYDGFRDVRDINEVPMRDLQQEYLVQQVQPTAIQHQALGTGDNGELRDLRRELQNCDLNQCNTNRIDPQCERTIF